MFRFAIGTQYMSQGKVKRVCTVVDQLTVTNAAGEVIKRYYKTSHEFMGQMVYEHDVCDTTIARNLIVPQVSRGSDAGAMVAEYQAETGCDWTTALVACNCD